MTLVGVNDKEMSSIQQSIPFQEKNKPDSILVKLASVESALDLDWNYVNSNLFCDPKRVECFEKMYSSCKDRVLFLVQMNAVIIFQKKPSRVNVIDENIEDIKVIESTPQEKEKTKVNCWEMHPSTLLIDW